MRILLHLVAMLVLPASQCLGQSIGTVRAVPERGYKALRENEDWWFLQNPALADDPWDAWKHIRLRTSDSHWYVSLGGESRDEWQQIGNDNWGQKPIMNGYFLQRYMFHVDGHYGKFVRTFVQLESGLESFRAGGVRVTDEKRLDFLAAFLEIGSPGAIDSAKLRIGRQELSFGSGRLVGIREGANVRLSFNGFRVKRKLDRWSIDGFAVRPSLDKTGFFDNTPNSKTSFWGLYSTRSFKKVSLDAYYLGVNRQRSTFQRGSAQEVRQSAGARLWRPIQNQLPGWDFDYEAIWQFGSFGTHSIRAWTVASDTPDIASQVCGSNRALALGLTLLVVMTHEVER